MLLVRSCDYFPTLSVSLSPDSASISHQFFPLALSVLWRRIFALDEITILRLDIYETCLVFRMSHLDLKKGSFGIYEDVHLS